MLRRADDTAVSKVEDALLNIHRQCIVLETLDPDNLNCSTDLTLFATRTRRQVFTILSQVQQL